MTTAVFLGAGASRAFGYPLTNQLLPRILTRLSAGKLFSTGNPGRSAEELETREWFRVRLVAFLPGLKDQMEKGNDDLGVGVTDLLTLVDRAIAHGESRAGMSPEEVPRFRQLLERAIYEAIMRDTDRRTKASEQALKRFFGWMDDQQKPTSIVTTNYDMAVDSCIIKNEGRTDKRQWNSRVAGAVDFSFSWRRSDFPQLMERPAKPEWRVHKLHGSVNWLRCPLCGQITMSLRSARGSKAFAADADEWNTCQCDGKTRLRLHLVTPSLIRNYQDPQLLGIWQAALEALRTADRWVIIGYSLPAEDVAIRSLFLRAWDAHHLAKKPKVVVVQRENPATQKTYQAFFPKASLDYRTKGLDGFLEDEGV